MTETEAAGLVARIRHTWRGGPHVDVWRETLVDLDAGTAGTTIVRLARDVDDCPSIAGFLRAYRGLHTAANDPVPPPPLPPICSECLTLLDPVTRQPTRTGCRACRIPDPTTGYAIALAHVDDGRGDLAAIRAGVTIARDDVASSMPPDAPPALDFGDATP